MAAQILRRSGVFLPGSSAAAAQPTLSPQRHASCYAYCHNKHSTSRVFTRKTRQPSEDAYEESHMTPYERDDLKKKSEEREGQFIVYRSPASAEHYPNYECIAKFPTLKHAETYVRLHAMP